MTDPTALDYWTLVIAVVGALTGVAALVAQVWSTVLAGPRVKVTVANAFIPGDDGWWLSLDASNVGRLPVTVLDMGVTFETNGKRQNVPAAGMPANTRQGPSPPHRLADAEASTWLLRPAVLAVALMEHGVTDVRGYVRLTTGKTVRSSKAIDVAALASLR